MPQPQKEENEKDTKAASEVKPEPEQIAKKVKGKKRTGKKLTEKKRKDNSVAARNEAEEKEENDDDDDDDEGSINNAPVKKHKSSPSAVL